MVRAMGVLGATFKTLDAIPVLTFLEVEWENLRRSMGRATISYDSSIRKMHAKITFSSALWPHAPSDKDRDETVIHEVCHIVDGWKIFTDPYYPRDGGHKEPWKKLMRKCGLEPSRCFAWKRPEELKNKPRERYEIHCKGCGNICRPTIIVVRRLLSGENVYFCPKCKLQFRPTDIKSP